MRTNLLVRRRSLFLVALIAAAPTALAGCSAGDDPAADTSDTSEDEVRTCRHHACDAGVDAHDAAVAVDAAPATTDAASSSDAAAHDAGSTSTPDAGGASLSPSGVPLPVGDIPGWHQIFADDFPTDVPIGSFPTAVSATWWDYPDGWKDTSKNGTYYPSKVVSISSGVMNLHLHTENGVHMVAAPVPKLPGTSSPYGQLYGRYAIRFRADAVAGFKTAWLLWPDSGVWPRDGEIDFPEGNLTGTICAFMHRQNGTSGSDQDAYCTAATYPTWHTAVTEWSPAACRFILDGAVIGTSTSRIPDTSMHYVIQTETALDGTVPSDTAQANVQIDWVAIYKPM